ncbi:acyl-coenzyme A amino acid N-acyltransferase 2-like [Liolophura sinensis]|uniref:acyl-coenzyme A amino acid N-acyltransferase 2-like n=1 Tax=Liolophura sinensis TaxID=3198878 RepID=UPI0031596036
MQHFKFAKVVGAPLFTFNSFQVQRGRNLRTRLLSWVMSWNCPQRRDMVSLTADKPDDLIDNPVQLTVSGLKAGQRVTCHASVEENKKRFSSHAHFLANHSGEVNLESSASLGGSYTGVDGMGLFWSMSQSPGQQSGLRLAKKDVTTPLVIHLSLYDGHQTAADLYGTDQLQPLAMQTINRWYLSHDVTRSEVRHGNIRGTLFTPAGTGPFKGVIDMFGTAGGIMEFRAALLASRGFIVLSLPYFNYQDLPKSLVDVDFSYFLEAVNWFSALPKVHPGGVGVVGVSMGGEIGLWMAVHCPQISAVVNISGNPFLGLYPLKFGSKELPGVGYDFSKLTSSEEGMAFRPGLPTVLTDKSFYAPIQKSKAKVLIQFGDDDQMNPVEPQYNYLEWLPESKREDVELCVYPQTGHLIEPSYSPFCRASFHILVRDNVVWGGEARAHSANQVIAWRKLQVFLHENVGQDTATTKDFSHASRL